MCFSSYLKLPQVCFLGSVSFQSQFVISDCAASVYKYTYLVSHQQIPLLKSNCSSHRCCLAMTVVASQFHGTSICRIYVNARETEVKDTFALGQGYTSVLGKGVTTSPCHYLSVRRY